MSRPEAPERSTDRSADGFTLPIGISMSASFVRFVRPGPSTSVVRPLAVLLSITLAACGGDSGTGPGDGPRESTVGSSGGTVAVTGGSGSSSGATVVIPAGALSTPTAITIAAMSSPPANPNLVAGTSWSFGPSGTQFSAPVEMRIRYDETRIPDELPEGSLYIAKNVGGSWQRISGTITVDSAQNVVRGTVTSFSDYTILADACTPRPIPSGFAEYEGVLGPSDCLYSNGPVPSTQEHFSLRVTTPTAYYFDVITDGFRPYVGVKEPTGQANVGAFWAIRTAPAQQQQAQLFVALSPADYMVFVGHEGGTTGGEYYATATPISADNILGCQVFWVRPPYTHEQAIDPTTDCVTNITVSPDPDFIGAEIAEEYYRIRVRPGETLEVTATRVSGEFAFSPFPTLFIPSNLGGGTVQWTGDGNASTKTLSYTASASGYITLGVSSNFTDKPSNGGRYTQGSYLLGITIR